MSRDNLRKLKLTHFFRSSKQQQIMKKNNNKTNVLNTNTGVQHVQIAGVAYYDESKYFMFAPDFIGKNRVPSLRMRGVAQQMSDGTFDFVAQPKKKPLSQLIKKLAHGRVSKTADGAIQLTLKVYCDEGVNIGDVLADEAEDASEAVVEYQLKH
jgi:hypothetical protein